MIPFLIARWFTADWVYGHVPLSRLAFRQMWWARLIHWSALAAALLVILWNARSGSVFTAAPLVLGLMGMAVLALMATSALSIRGSLDRHRGVVHLRGVHPAFVAAFLAPAPMAA